MKQLKITIAVAVAFLFSASGLKSQTVPSPNENQPDNIIQLALLLDVSGSMEGLINQAKTELWGIVNAASKASKNNQQARLEIALYEYGRTTNPASDGYIRMLLDFTTDLDTISKVLFSLATNGGDEYCGYVIDDAVKKLQWRESDSIYRVIFIAGNEPFTQGNVDYKKASSNAADKKVIINTIHCGDSLTGVKGEWLNGAKLGRGKYFYINHNAAYVDISTPYDSLIDALNDSLNTTYIAYGSRGMEYKLNQSAQDINTKGLNKKAYYERAEAKSKGGMYRNSHWDLIDAAKADSTIINKVKPGVIDSAYAKLDKTGLKKLIDEKASKRQQFQNEIARLTAMRSEFIRNHPSSSKTVSLGDALKAAIRLQAAAKGFEFKN